MTRRPCQAHALIPAAEVAGDFNVDGRSDVAVWRQPTRTWYVRGVETVRHGQAGDVPVLGDFNGDGWTDVAVWRPSTGIWYVRSQFEVPYGERGDIPV